MPVVVVGEGPGLRSIWFTISSTVMPSLRFKSEVQEALILASAQLQTSALITQQSRQIDHIISGDDDLDGELADFDKAESDARYAMGSTLISFASAMSARGPRGPYNLPKCKDFFPMALSWPDREFRHTFR